MPSRAVLDQEQCRRPVHTLKGARAGPREILEAGLTSPPSWLQGKPRRQGTTIGRRSGCS